MFGARPGRVSSAGKVGGMRRAPSFALDFINNPVADSRLALTRTGRGFYTDLNGNMALGAANAQRISYAPARQLLSANNALTMLVTSAGVSTALSTAVPALFSTSGVQRVTANGTNTNLSAISVTPPVVGSVIVGSIYIWIPSSWPANSLQVNMEGALSGNTVTAANMNLRDQWQRIWAFATSTAVSAQNVVIRSVSNPTNGQFFYTTGWQMEYGTVPSTYQPGTGSAVLTEPLGLLIEETRTNNIRNARSEGASVSTLLAAPAAPTLGSAVSGAIGATTYFVTVTFVDGAGGETVASAESTLAVAANSVLTVTSPALTNNAAQYKIYASTATGTEVLQATVNMGTNWQEPDTGLIGGAAAPGTGTAKNQGTIPTNFIIGGGLQTGGISIFNNGVSIEAGIPYWEFQLIGTNLSAGAFANIFSEATGQVAAANGQTWAAANNVRLIAGTLANMTMNISLYGRLASTANNESFQTAITPTAAPLSTQRTSSVGTFASVNTVFAAQAVGIVVGSAGVAINATFRLALPQLEQGSLATTPILPLVGTPAATARGIDSIPGLTGIANPSVGTIVAEGIFTQVPINGVNTELVGLGTDTSNLIRAMMGSTGNTIVVQDFIANVGQGTVPTSAHVLTANGITKVALSYSGLVLSVSTLGDVVTSGTVAALPTLSTLFIGGSNSRGNVLNGYLRKLAYYPRNMPAAEMQAKST